jgi:hypothetical protein
VKKWEVRREIPEEIDKIGPESLKVTIRQTDRGDTVEDANLYDEDFGGFGASGEDGPYTATFRVTRRPRRLIGYDGGPALGALIRRRPELGPHGWAAIQPSDPYPFVRQAVRELEQVRPDPDWRPHAEWLEALERRLRKLDEPTDPNAGPSASYARGVLREERFQFFAQHTERRVQKLYCRQYKPSAVLEAKRLPRLPVVATKLVPKDVQRQPAAERRAGLNDLVAQFLSAGGQIKKCPPETTTAQRKRKIGRPSIGDRAMTNRERKRRQREREKHELIKLRQPLPRLAICPASRLRP